jgi:hypothetical protein
MQISADSATDMPPDLAEKVSKNLNGWDFPVGEKDGEAYTHVLKVTIGTIKHGLTPTGLSFSAGNSDPRAIEFQKADVLPISCAFSAVAHPEQRGTLSMDFMADRSDKAYLAIDKLADHISTVCFNLLTEIKWPLKEKTQDPTRTIKSSDWIPEIRIEEKLSTDAPATAPVAPATVPSSSPTSQEASKPKPNVTIQRDEPRRQIIIHNEGSPVILEFGHERR